jgi:hypothetical protein
VFSGCAKVSLGKVDAAVECLARAMRLSPPDPQVFSMHTALDYADALSWAETAMRELPIFVLPMCIATTSAALAGRLHEAREVMARLRKLRPALRLSDLNHTILLRRPEDFARWTDGLRRAGLPE